MKVNRDKIVAFLEAHHASSTAHTGRTFLRHLEGTERILRDWQTPEYVQLAGLFHSIYGTNIFTIQSASFGEREEVSALIGQKAEWLAYLFCVASRPEAFFAIAKLGYLKDRVTGMTIPVTEHEMRDLLLMEAANHIEQSMGKQLVKRIHDLYEHDYLVSEQAKAEMFTYAE